MVPLRDTDFFGVNLQKTDLIALELNTDVHEEAMISED